MAPLEHARQLIDKAWKSPDQWTCNYKAAQAILQAALAANPEDPILLTSLGAVLSDRGQHAAAVVPLEKAIALGSSDRNTYQNLAIALMNCDDEGRTRAPALFKKAQELEPCPQTWEAYFDPHGH